jgi:putative DNA primase/helicase
MTDAEAVRALLDAMERAGVRPVESIAGELLKGRLVRFRAEGDRAGRRNGWATLMKSGLELPYGNFGHWRLGVRWTGRLGKVEDVTPAERARWARELAAAKALKARERTSAYDRGRAAAVALWNASPKADGAHPYLARKRIAPDSLRQHGRFLLVPMRDPCTGTLWNVQRIGPDGFKLFTPGARVRGLLWGRGLPGARLALCEGMATAAAVNAATGLCTFAAFTKAGLETAATAIRSRWPSAALAIGADVDTDGGGGAAALDAAQAVGATVAIPPRPSGWVGAAWDYADLWASGEADAVRAALRMGSGR